MRRIQLTVFALGIALATSVGAPVSHAQSPGDGAQVGELFKAGQKALSNGQYRAAASHFAKVLRNNDLTSAQVAKALYMRGTAYEKDGRPAQAIADITSALYLSGLSSAERAKAYLVRGKAYEAVRLNDLARADISRARTGGVSEQQIARTSEAPRSRSGGNVPAFSTSVTPSGGGTSAPSFTTSSRSSQSRQNVPTFATSSQSGTTRSRTSNSTSQQRQTAPFETRSRSAGASEEQIPQFRTSISSQNTQPKKPPPARTARSSDSTPSGWNTSATGQGPAIQPEEESGSRVGRFFRGLRSRTTGQDEEAQTTSTPSAASPSTTASPSPQWTQTTRVARAPQPSGTSQVSSPPAQRSPAAPQPTTSASGGYRIQLAALRTDAEAQATWKRLRAKHGALLGSYQPSIVKTDLGGLGTFYRVQLGPFSDKAATQQLCKNFKSGGLDCFLLAQ